MYLLPESLIHIQTRFRYSAAAAVYHGDAYILYRTTQNVTNEIAGNNTKPHRSPTVTNPTKVPS